MLITVTQSLTLSDSQSQVHFKLKQSHISSKTIRGKRKSYNPSLSQSTHKTRHSLCIFNFYKGCENTQRVWRDCDITANHARSWFVKHGRSLTHEQLANSLSIF